jgi:hypothetical protein
MSSYDSFRRAIEKVQGPLTPTMGPSFRGRPTPYGITEGDVDLPYDPDAILPPDAPVDQQVIGTTAAITPSPAVAAPVATAPAKDLLAAAEQQSDPYGALTKTQKRMLAFAAIADAGMALQGKEGTKVATLLGDFTRRADQARKERQAQIALDTETARREQLMAMLGGASIMPTQVSTGAGDMTAAEIEQQIAQLAGQMGVYAGLDQLDAFNTRMDILRTQLEDARTKETAATEKRTINEGKLNQAQDALVYAERALAASTGLEGEELTEFLDKAKTGDADLDPRGFLLTRQSYIPDALSPAFMDFQAAISTLSSIMTFQNMAEVTEAGARLGILSDSDMRILGNMSGELDPVNKPKQTAQTVMDLYGKINKTIDKLREEAGEGNDELQRLRDKYKVE